MADNMKFKRPEADDLDAVAASLGYELDADTRQTLLQYATGFSDSFEYIAAQPDELPSIRYPERSYRSAGNDNSPTGGWAVRAEIRGANAGPLKGRTVAIKDNVFVAGVPMLNGTEFLEGFVPDFDATVVTRLLDAGATITGKAQCEYLCCSGGSGTAAAGMVRNPVNPRHSAGGSSSGSAALVGAGEVDMAVGCDQAGSIRIPASWSGICGLKPTHGLVPYTGILGMESTLDYTGPMTANVADNALMLEVMAGPDGLDGRQRNVEVHRYTESLGRDIRGMRVGVVREGFGQELSEIDVDECVRAAAERLRELGTIVEEVSVPMHAEGVSLWGGVISDGLAQTLRLNGIGYNTDGVYSPAFCRAMQGWQAHIAGFPVNAKLFVLLGKYLERYNGLYYAKAKNLVRRLRRAYDTALGDHDLLLMPTTVMKAFPQPASAAELTTDHIMSGAFLTITNTCQFDITGHPALSIPCGMRDGLPVGMMLVARHWDEPAIYRAAHAFEGSLDWRTN